MDKGQAEREVGEKGTVKKWRRGGKDGLMRSLCLEHSGKLCICSVLTVGS